MLPKHELFCYKYIQNGRNATKAYLASGYKCSANAAKANAARLLKRSEIQKQIQGMSQQVIKNEQIQISDIVRELCYIAFSSLHSCINENGGWKQFHELTPECIAALDKYELRKHKNGSFTLNIKFKDKLKALDILAKHLGMFDKKRNQTDNEWKITINKTYDPNEFNKGYNKITE
ncbi:MAG TPA: terminase small subunit [bacterium]|nr:terminase small subunit [bacterium]HPN43929.1 terminase small subunit [bacterium]